MIKRLAVVGALLLALSGCTVVHSGQVVDKDHQEAYSTTTIQPISYDGGKTFQYIPVTQYHPESWNLWVCEAANEKGNRRCSWWGVHEGYYNDTEIGDWISDGK